MKLHTKYYMKFLWLQRYTSMEYHQLHYFIKSIGEGHAKRLGDYKFRLLQVKRAGRDTLYSIEVYSIDKKGKSVLVLKSPVLIDPPHRRIRTMMAA